MMDHELHEIYQKYFSIDNEAEKIVNENIPWGKYSIELIKEKCRKEYFDSTSKQIRLFNNVLGKYVSVIKPLNELIEQQKNMWDEINKKKELKGESRSSRSTSKAEELRDGVLLQYDEGKKS